MMIDGDDGGDPRLGATLRGAVVIVLAGLALGALHNTIGRTSRPPRGLPWSATANVPLRLEALQDAPVTVVPPNGVVALDPGKPAAPRVGPAKPAPSAQRTTTTTTPTPAATTPPPASAPASALPVIPDLDRPVRLELASLKKLYDAGAVLVVDARDASEYADGHVAGALSLPFNDASGDPSRIEHLGEAGRPIAVYCSGGACELSMDLAKLMIEHGRKKVLVFEGGYPEWQAASYPVARGAEPGSR
jgi:rhodanese-related sulfurtransferase